MSDSRRRVAALTAEERAVVAERVVALRGGPAAGVPLRAGSAARAAASFAQERLWFVDSLQRGRGVYNISVALPFAGPLNVRALAQSLAFVAARHEALRTTFSLGSGALEQIIQPPASVAMPLLDLRRAAPEERAAELDRATARELDEGFDLEAGPLVRAVLVRESDTAHTLLVTTHHICSDGWSVGILQRELGVAYAAFSRGITPSLPPLPVQYADFSVWQRARYERGEYGTLIDFWRRAMTGAPRLLTLPLDRPRPLTPSMNGAWRGINIAPAMAAALLRIAAGARTTLFMALLAAYAAVLHRFSGQDDVVIGIPIANRSRLELEPLIGFFVNALPIRVTFSRHDTFAGLLARVRDAALAAYQHQELPFEKLVEELNPDRDPRHHPLFQATFSLQNLPTLAVAQAPEPEHRADVLRGSIKFDLSLHLRETADRAVTGSLGYATDPFDDDAGAAFAETFLATVANVAARPERSIADAVPGVVAPLASARKSIPIASGTTLARTQNRPSGIAAVEGGEVSTWAEVMEGNARTPLGRALADAVGAGLDPAADAAIVAVVEAANITAKSLIVVGALEPALFRRAALVAAAASCAITAPADPADAASIIDHATWEGATHILLDVAQARRLAADTYVPLHGIALVVDGTPLPPAVAALLVERGATGVVIGSARDAWSFLALLEDLARRPLLGRPLTDLTVDVRDRYGNPLPFGAVGRLWSEGEIVLELPVRFGIDGAVELVLADEPLVLEPLDSDSTPLAEALAGIWADVLGRPVSLDDDFFAIGGQSLRAVQAVARVRDLLRVAMPVQQLFTARTVRRLASELASEEAERAASVLLEVARLSPAEAERRLAQLREVAS